MPNPSIFFFTYANDPQRSLDLPNEWRKVEEALQAVHDAGRIDFNLTPSTTKVDIWNKFNRFHNRISVFHYSGHSNAKGLDLTESLLGGEQLATLLSQEEGLRLVFLNGCSNVAQVERLLNKGVAAIIATNANIEDQRAIQLAEQFYRALASGRSIRQSFEVAAAYVNEEAEEVLVEYRQMGRQHHQNPTRFPWGLYTRSESQLNWKIPPVSATTTATTSAQKQLNAEHFQGQLIMWEDKEKGTTTFHTPFPRPRERMVGRASELQQMRDHFLQNQLPLAVSGMGGLGKTRLAIAYANAYYQEYPYLLWFEQKGDLYNDLLAFVSAYPELKKALAFESSQEPERDARMLFAKLAQLEGILLIIDNTDEQLEAIADALPKAPQAHVLLTSRSPLERFATPLSLDFLDQAEAQELFYTHYQRERADEIIAHILQTVDFHTLTIELLAKTAAKRKLSLTRLQALLEERGLALGRRADDVRLIRDPERQLKRIFPFLQAVFDLSSSELGEAEKDLLGQLAALPAIFMPLEELAYLLGYEEEEEEQWDDFTIQLEQIVAKGWLIYQEEQQETDGASTTTEVYKMHRVVQDVVWEQLQPAPPTLEPLIDRVAAMLNIDQSKDNPVDKFPLVPYGERLLHRFNSEDGVSLAALRDSLAGVYQELGQYTKAKELYEGALNWHNSTGSESDTARLQSNLALVLKALGDYVGARELSEKALASDEQHFGAIHPSTARSQSNLALVLKALGDYVGARELLEKVLAFDEQHFGANHPAVAISQSNLATVLQALGDYAGARELLEKALASDEQHFGASHPSTARSQSNLAVVLQDLGDYEGARKLLEKALASSEQHFGASHPSTAISQSNLATVLQDLGDYAGARELLEKALASSEQHFGASHPSTAISQSNLATVLQDLGDYAGARELLEKALASSEQHFGASHPTVARRQSNLALVLKDLEEYERAIPLLIRAYHIFADVLGEEHPNSRIVKGNLQHVIKAGVAARDSFAIAMQAKLAGDED